MSAHSKPGRHGSLVVVASTRGGAGASTLSAGLAVAGSRRTGGGVLLVDACQKGGQLAPRMGINAHPNLVGLVSGINERNIKNSAARREAWKTHAQQVGRGRRPIWVIASPGEPLAAHWYTHRNLPTTLKFLTSVASSDVPVICDVGELTLTSQLGWGLARAASTVVLIVAGSDAPVSDIDIVYTACSLTRTLVVVPGHKRERESVVDFWAHSVLGGWGLYRDRLTTRSKIGARLSARTYADSPYLGVQVVNAAQQRLLEEDDKAIAQTLVPAPVGVKWWPQVGSAAALCQRGSLPSGSVGKAVKSIAVVAFPKPGAAGEARSPANGVGKMGKRAKVGTRS